MARWGKCDYKQLKKLQENINELANGDAIRFYEECARELAARLLRKVIKRTPVGENQYETKTVNGKQKKYVIRNGGTLRRGWTARTEEEAENGSSQNAKDWANSLAVKKIGDIFQIEVINPVHYASYVEYGHRQEPGRYVPAIGKRLVNSWVNGVFMLTISEKEIESQAPKILEKKLLEYLEESFNV